MTNVFLCSLDSRIEAILFFENLCILRVESDNGPKIQTQTHIQPHSPYFLKAKNREMESVWGGKMQPLNHLETKNPKKKATN